MAYFPMFTELEGETVLVIGGGRTALHKVQRLSAYGAAFVVIAPAILPEFDEIRDVMTVYRRFEPEDVSDDYVFVIAATRYARLNHEIADICRRCRVPVNVVDDPEACSFLFPSLVKRGRLSIGISTGGASPTAAHHLKEEIDSVLPDGIEEILDWLHTQRAYVRERFPEEAQRGKIYEMMYAECMRLGRPLTNAELVHLFVPGSGGEF